MLIHPSSVVALACAGALFGCAAPKIAAIVEQTSKPPAKVESADTQRVVKLAPDDSLRTGDLLVLPKDTEYRASAPALPKSSSGAGTVIVNPPSQPKPKPSPRE